MDSSDRSLLRFARMVHIPVSMHHLTVHSNGRCFLRIKAIRALGIPDDVKWLTVTVCSSHAILTFFTTPAGRRRHGRLKIMRPRSGTGGSMFFYSRFLSRKAALLGVSRLRFMGRAEKLTPYSYGILLSFSPVRDIYAILQSS